MDLKPTRRRALRMVFWLPWMFLASLLHGAAPVKILPLGDSITRGTNDINFPNGDIPGGYRRQLGVRLTNAGESFDFIGSATDNAAPGMDPDHAGFNGFRTDEFITALPALLGLDPEIVLLQAGTNDILQGVPVATALANLDTLIQQITEEAPDRRLYVATLIPIQQDWDTRTAAALNAEVDAFNTGLRDLIPVHTNAGRDVVLVDMSAHITLIGENPQENFFQPGDGIHPGQAGYNQMGAIWFDSIRFTRTLQVESSLPSGIPVTTSPPDLHGIADGITSFSRRYADDAVVNLTAPQAVGRFRFQKWTRNGTPVDSNPATQVTMDASHTMTAVYAEVTPDFPTGLRIMPIGDSITYGFNGGNAGYRGPLYELLYPLAPEFRFIGSSIRRPGNLPTAPIDQRHNEGHSSYTIQDISNNLDGFDDARFLEFGGPERDPNGGYWFTGGNGTGRDPAFPDIITLMIGTTELENLTGVETRLRDLITKITTLRPTAKLFVAKIIPQPGNPSVDVYNEIVSTVVEDFLVEGKNIHLVDMNTGFPIDGLDPDGVHPNDTGFGFIAGRWFEAIVAAYSPRTLLVPYGGAPRSLPGIIQAEDFDAGGEGVAYQDLTENNEGGAYRETEGVDIEATGDEGGGHQVFSTESGEWLKYTVHAESAGAYLPSLRVNAADEGSEIRLEVDGVDASGPIPIPQSSGPDDYQTLLLPEIHFTPGDHVLRLVITSGGAAVNWLSFSSLSTTGPTANAGPDMEIVDLDGNGTQNVALDATASLPGDFAIVSHTWSENAVTLATGAQPTVQLAMGTHVIELLTTDSNGLQDTDEITVTVSPKTFINGGFESSFDGWTTSGNLSIEATPPYAATQGIRLAAFNSGNRAPNAILSQSFATLPGKSYTLEFDVGVLSYNTSSQRMQVSVTGTGSLLSQTINLTGIGGGRNLWQPRSFTFTADSAFTTLTFRDLSTVSFNLDLLLDNVRVTAINAAPVATGDSYSTSENQTLEIPAPGVLGNDTDVESGPLSAILVSPPSNGNLALSPDGGFIYTPANGYFGNDSFTYRASDGTASSNATTVSITVAEVIPAPLAGDDLYQTNGSEPLTVPAAGILSNDQDPRSRPLAAVIETEPAHGSLTLDSNGGFIYTASPAYVGSDSFTYRADNGTRTSLPATVTLTVNPYVPTPVAVADSYTTAESTALVIEAPGVLTNDNDPGSNSLTAVADSQPAHGALDLAPDGSFTYTPAPGFFGNDSFTYHADNGSRPSAPVAVSLTVTEVIPAPIAVADSYTCSGPSLLVAQSSGVLANDSDPRSRPLTAEPVTQPLHGQLVLNPDGGFTYTPESGFSGTDGFTYRATNGTRSSEPVEVVLTVDSFVFTGIVNGSFESGLTGWTASGNLNIQSTAPYAPTDGIRLVGFNGGNQTPNAVLSQAFATAPGQSYTLAFDAGVFSFNTNTQTIQATVTGNGSLLSRTVTLTGSGNGNRWSPQSFTFTANSSSTTLTFRDLSSSTTNLDLMLDKVRVTSNQSSPNTAPTAMPDSYAVIADAPLIISAPGVLANDSDAESSPLTTALLTAPGHGSLVLGPGGNFVYTPDSGYTGSDSFTYRASDGSLNSNSATVTLTIAAAATGGLVNGSFESGFTGWTTTGNLFIESAAPYTASNGAKLVGFNGGNLSPNGTLSQSFATTAGQTYTLAFDAGVLAFVSSPQTLQVTVTGSSTLLTRSIGINGTPGGNSRWFPQSFTFTANSPVSTLTFRDQSASTAGLDLLLDHVRVDAQAAQPNTAPVATADTYSTLRDTLLNTPAPGVLANDTDAQSQALSATLVTGPANGSLTLNPDGGFTYQPAASFTGTDSFTYRAGDGSLVSNIATVTLTVSAPAVTTLVNGSFESGLTGWTSTGNLAVQSNLPYQATAGSRLISFNGGNQTPNGLLSQTLPTTPGQTYILAFDLGVLAFVSVSQTLQVTATGTGTLLTRTLVINGTGNGVSRWLPQSFTFVADSAATTLAFRDQSTTTLGLDLLLDNVRLTAAATASSTSQPPAIAPAVMAALPASPMEPAVLSGTPSAFTIRTQATVPGIYVLERSIDLTNWQPAGEQTITTPKPVEFHDSPPPSESPAPSFFYRIRRESALPADR